MASIKDISISARENGIAFSLGVKTEVLTEVEVNLLVKTIKDLIPQVKKVRKERLIAELATAEQVVEGLRNELKDLNNKSVEIEISEPNIDIKLR